MAFKPKYVEIFRAHPLSNCLNNGFAPINHIKKQVRMLFQGSKNLDFQGPPLPMALVMYSICTHQKHYARGRINHRCINSYYVYESFA